jgi:hypothetical protein
VLITGGSEGLGVWLARELSRRRFRVTLVGRRKERLEEVIGELTGSGHGFIVRDLADEAQAESLSKTVAEQPFDVLVNNAGASRYGRLDQLSCAHVRGIIQLNFATPALLSWAFLRSAPTGAMLVNVTSVVGTMPMPGNATYAAAKAALQYLTECIWYEGTERGINVLDFRPVSLRTGFHKAAGNASMAASWMTIVPERAAKDLAEAIESRRGFVYPYGRMARALTAMNRTLPKRWLVKMMGRHSKRMGYL